MADPIPNHLNAFLTSIDIRTLVPFLVGLFVVYKSTEFATEFIGGIIGAMFSVVINEHMAKTLGKKIVEHRITLSIVLIFVYLVLTSDFLPFVLAMVPFQITFGWK